jgi:hypothetical protein
LCHNLEQYQKTGFKDVVSSSIFIGVILFARHPSVVGEPVWESTW